MIKARRAPRAVTIIKNLRRLSEVTRHTCCAAAAAQAAAHRARPSAGLIRGDPISLCVT